MKCEDFLSFNECWGFLPARTSCGGGRKGSLWPEEGHGASIRDHKAASACSVSGVSVDPARAARSPEWPAWLVPRTALFGPCYCYAASFRHQWSAAGDTLGPPEPLQWLEGPEHLCAPGRRLARDWGGCREGSGLLQSSTGDQAEAAPWGLARPCSAPTSPSSLSPHAPLGAFP